MRVTNALPALASGLITFQQAVAQSTPSYDYVIVGGGAAGLLIANRLSANPANTVAVIEPGTDQRNNPDVTVPQNFGRAIRSSIDWDYQSLPQPQMDNRVLKFSAGKGIGGSTLINGNTAPILPLACQCGRLIPKGRRSD